MIKTTIQFLIVQLLSNYFLWIGFNSLPLCIISTLLLVILTLIILLVNTLLSSMNEVLKHGIDK